MVKEKTCRQCGVTKPISEYYKHKNMPDGYLNHCKKCKKEYAKKAYDEKSKDKNWIESERKRHRDKYKRLNYNEKQKLWDKNKPWTKTSEYKNLSKRLKIEKGCEAHHWSYKKEHIKDVIILKTKTHRNWHKFLSLDRDLKCFKGINGEILDTKEKHIKYIQKHYPTKI